MNDESNEIGREQSRREECLKLCSDIRKFEIELFWKRFNSFWLINAAALAGFATTKSHSPDLSFLIACGGLVTSFCWILICFGSKWWQEAWEEKTRRFQNCLKKDEFDKNEEGIFDEPQLEKNSTMMFFQTTRFSVSGIATAVAIVTFCAWIIICLCQMMSPFSCCGWRISIDCRYAVLFIASLLACLVIKRGSRMNL